MKSGLDREVRQGLIDELGINLNEKFKPDEISGSIKNAFEQGVGEKEVKQKKKGVSQLDRKSYLNSV